MNNLSTRERIILGIVLAAVVYAGYVVLGGLTTEGPAEFTGQATENRLDGILGTMDERLTETSFKAFDQYLIAALDSDWARDPFLNMTSPFNIGLVESGPVTDTTTASADYQYSGFVKIGEDIMAIINNQEYRPGEELLSGGFRVTEIFPRRVILEALQSQGGGSGPSSIIIEIQE